MRLILYLILTTWGVCAKSNSDATNGSEEKLLQDYADKYSSERQFISTVKRWFLGRGNEKPVLKTEIKYLPIYVPVPVYSSMKVPSSSAFYGAHQHNREEKGEEIMFTPQVPNKPGLPYPHLENYELPYGSGLIPMLNEFPMYSYYYPYEGHPWKTDSTAYSDNTAAENNVGYVEASENNSQWSSENDSEVIDNPEILTDPTEETRVVKKKKNKKKRS